MLEMNWTKQNLRVIDEPFQNIRGLLSFSLWQAIYLFRYITSDDTSVKMSNRSRIRDLQNPVCTRSRAREAKFPKCGKNSRLNSLNTPLA